MQLFFFSFLFTESSDTAMLADTEEGTKDFAHLYLLDIYIRAWYIHDCMLKTKMESTCYGTTLLFVHVMFSLFFSHGIVSCWVWNKQFEVTIKLNHIIQCYTWRFTCAGERWISLKDFGTTVCFQLKLEIK